MDYTLNEDMLDKLFCQTKLLFVPFKDNKYSPRFLQSRVLFYSVILILVVRVAFISISLNFPKDIFFADVSRIDLVKMVNNERIALGLKPLGENTKLDKAAQLKAQDMLNNGYFNHQSPTGVTPWYWFGKSGYNYRYAGENLAIGFSESVDVYNAWFDSDSHRNIFLSPNYNEIGTAILTGNFNGSPATIVVQLFGKQKVVAPTAPAVAKPKPTNTVTKPTLPIKSTSAKNMVLSATSSSADLEKNLYSQILNIVFYNFDNILQKLIFILFVLVSALSVLNIIVNYKFQNRKLVFKSLVLVLLLGIGTFLDKEFLMQIINSKTLI